MMQSLIPARWMLALLPLVLACLGFEFPSLLSQQASTELDQILRAAHVELPWLNGEDSRASARDLMVATQKARIAIVGHVLEHTFTTSSSAASPLERARNLQHELMERVQSHLSMQLQYLPALHERFEWELHHGFAAGVSTAKDRKFIDSLLQQTPTWPVKDPSLLARLKAVMVQLDPFSAFRRWRIRRLLNKISTPGSSLDNLRARLSAVTAMKHAQAQAAAAEAKDLEAARRIDHAPAIQSEIKLDKGMKVGVGKKKFEKRPTKMTTGGGIGREYGWVKAFNRGPEMDWTDVPIPGMA